MQTKTDTLFKGGFEPTIQHFKKYFPVVTNIKEVYLAKPDSAPLPTQHPSEERISPTFNTSIINHSFLLFKIQGENIA